MTAVTEVMHPGKKGEKDGVEYHVMYRAIGGDTMKTVGTPYASLVTAKTAISKLWKDYRYWVVSMDTRVKVEGK